MAMFFFLLGQGFVLLACLVFYVMLGEVNGRRLPQSEISVLGMDIRKFMEVWNEHGRLYPNSRKQRQFVTFFLVGLALCLIAGYFYVIT